MDASLIVAQSSPNLRWYTGEIQFNDLTVWEGQVKLDPKKNIVHFKKNSQKYILLPKDVNHFKVYSEKNSYRLFVPAKIKNKKNRKEYAFFEVIYKGKSNYLLAQEDYYINSNSLGLLPSSYFFLDRSSGFRKQVIRKFYLLNEQQKLIKLVLFNNHVIKILDDEENKIREFIKKNSINCKHPDDLAKVIKFYDQL
jgi:hypothetical protein